MNYNIVIGPYPLCVVWPQSYQSSVSRDCLDFSCCRVCWNHTNAIRCLQWDVNTDYGETSHGVGQYMGVGVRDRRLPWWLRMWKVKWWVLHT